MRVVIFAHGETPAPDVVRNLLRQNDMIVCADGGANFAASMGLVPRAVIGDLDSVDPKLRATLSREGVEFIQYPSDKDQTDLELAIEFAVKQGCQELLLIAALGGRLDHLLTNVHYLARPEFKDIAISMVDHYATDQIVYILHGPTELSWQGKKDQEVSLVPLTAQVKGVTLSGTKWPLTSVTLEMGSPLTVSNRMELSSAQLKFESGTLLAIVPLAFPP